MDAQGKTSVRATSRWLVWLPFSLVAMRTRTGASTTTRANNNNHTNNNNTTNTTAGTDAIINTTADDGAGANTNT